jgi:uncharacterized Zn-binding protein involved in type VI secretion
MTAISRITDLGEGTCAIDGLDYITTFVSGATSVFINGLPVAIISTLGDQDCGHVSVASTGSSNVFVEGMAVHRIADTGLGEGEDIYTVITGSPDVFNDGG